MEKLEVNSPVRFVRGSYKDKLGTVTKLTPQKAYVSSPDIAEIVCVMQTSLQLNSPQPTAQTAIGSVRTPLKQQSSMPQPTKPSPLSSTPCRSSSRLAGNQPAPPSPFQLPTTPDAKRPSFGGRPIKKIVLEGETPGSQQESTFLSTWLGKERWLQQEVPLPSHSSKLPTYPELTDSFDGVPYEFVASKVFEDGTEAWGGKKKSLRMVFAAVAGPNLPAISLQDELEKVADWRALPSARKVASRLELLQSPGEVHFELRPGVPLCPEMFELIDEPLTDESGGCGFIPEAMLQQLLSGGKERLPIAAKRATSIQVRMIITRKDASGEDVGGVWKGVLTAKANTDKIQLPLSMRKVPGSRNAEKDMVCLVVTGKDPSNPNLQMVKLANGDEPCKSFKQTKFSEMIERLLVQGLHVPRAAVLHYAGRGGRERHLRKEAWFRAVADPTNGIPSGFVFASGLPAAILPLVHDEHCIFVTRSPCVLPEHGRVLRVLTERPAGMVAAAWAWLQQQHFGTLVFPCVGPPWPELIAQGDTDGDRNFVCWDGELVALLAERCAPCPLSVEAPPPQSTCIRLGDDWLAQARAHMLDPSTLRESVQIGKTHTLMVKVGDESGWEDPDYKLLARAYVQAIDGVKHGGAVVLPLHLREKLGLEGVVPAA